MTALERFEAKYTPEPNTGCWLWTACLSTDGYGQFRFEGRNHSTHRFSYKLYVGPIPKGLFVLHKCDVKLCVNPDHLFLGTHTDNMTDMVSKGRNAERTGEKNGKAKLTPTEVLAIRTDTRFQRVIAAEYGVRQAAISKIKLGKTWAHI